jgi:membrane fusion protein, heavy metal efflux system
VMTIVNGQRVQISANIYEKDLQQVKLGQLVQVTVNGLPGRTFEGRVSIIDTVVDQQTRVVPIKAELNNADAVLKPGMFAELDVLTNQLSQTVLAIPKSAIVETNDQKTIVFVQNGDAFQSTDVTLGQSSGDVVEIKEGLFEGDQVVTQRALQLYAQTLRGGAKTAENKEKQTPQTAESPQMSSLTMFNWQALPILGWVVFPGVGAIAAGTFWLGRRSAKSSLPEVDALASALLAHAGNPESNGNAHAEERDDESQLSSHESR